jgi:hypothetical protein
MACVLLVISVLALMASAGLFALESIVDTLKDCNASFSLKAAAVVAGLAYLCFFVAMSVSGLGIASGFGGAT